MTTARWSMGPGIRLTRRIRWFGNGPCAATGRTVTLTDQGLRERGAPPTNLKQCERGRWNERVLIETNFSWLTEFFDAKKL